MQHSLMKVPGKDERWLSVAEGNGCGGAEPAHNLIERGAGDKHMFFAAGDMLDPVHLVNFWLI